MHELLDKIHVCVETLNMICADETMRKSKLQHKGTPSLQHKEQMHAYSHAAEALSISDITQHSSILPLYNTIAADTLHQQIQQADTLHALKEIMTHAPHPFKHFSKNLVFGDGVSESGIMIIGEAPGAEEDEQRKAFVGQSGILLMDIFKTIGLDRKKNFYITNIVPFRPSLNQTPSLDEIRFFLPYIKRHIELVSPKILILIGATAYKAISMISDMNDSQTITQLHGKINLINIDKLQLHACVLLHPSYLLRLPSQKKNMWRDMLYLEVFLKKTYFIKPEKI